MQSVGIIIGVLAAIVLGWGIGAFVHLVFGSPGGRPTAQQVERALRGLGIVVTDLQPASAV